MHDPDQPATAAETPGTSRRSRWKWLGFSVSLALVAAACWAVRGQWSGLSLVGEALHSGRWWMVLAAVLLPAANWLLTGLIFYFLMLPVGVAADRRAVSVGEMLLLIGSSWLFNYLPLSPGLIGRVAYHKAVHRVPVAASVGVLIAASAIGMCVVAAILLIVCVAGKGFGAQAYAATLGTPALVLGLLAFVGSRSGQAHWRYLAAAAVRWLDVLVWMARYAVVFDLIGRPLSLPEATAIAAASQAAMQVPLVGNGLGVREWAVGLVGPVLPPWMNAASGGLSRGLGLSADLLNRGCELVAAIPVGLACTAALARRQGR